MCIRDRASTAPHSSPDPPPATDPDNSSTAPDRPTTDAPSRVPGLGCRAREPPDQDADLPAPANSETRSSTRRPAPAIPGLSLIHISIGDLIARVEKEYQSGQGNYRAGHLEAAKQNFDSAFNQLLGSGFDLRSTSDDRLERELDRILDGINGLELAALQQEMCIRDSVKPTAWAIASAC